MLCYLQVLPHERQYFDALPSSSMYEKSYMHKDNVTHVKVSISFVHDLTPLARLSYGRNVVNFTYYQSIYATNAAHWNGFSILIIEISFTLRVLLIPVLSYFWNHAKAWGVHCKNKWINSDNSVLAVIFSLLHLFLDFLVEVLVSKWLHNPFIYIVNTLTCSRA